MSAHLDEFFHGARAMGIQQLKEWVEVLSNFETVNRYEILDDQGGKVGYAAETGGGFLRTLFRWWLKSHRPLEIHVTDAQGRELLFIKRPFYFFWSNMAISGPDGALIGRAKRRFGIIYKKYDLVLGEENVFGRIRAPFWRLWTFPVLDEGGSQVGVISKKWGGFLKEAFTDADRFMVEFPDGADNRQKAVILGSALSVDLDYFEENVGRSAN